MLFKDDISEFAELKQ